MRQLFLTALVSTAILAVSSEAPAAGSHAGVDLHHDTFQGKGKSHGAQVRSRKRLAPSDLIQAGGLDPKVSFANFLTSNAQHYNKKALAAQAAGLHQDLARGRRAASVSLGKSRNGKGKKKDRKKNRKGGKGKGNKKRNKNKKRKGKKNKNRKRNKSKNSNNKNRRAREENDSKSGARRRRTFSGTTNSNHFRGQSVGSDVIDQRLKRRHDSRAYSTTRQERANYWKNKRINKRGLDSLPSVNSKGKSGYDDGMGGKNYLYDFNDPFSSSAEDEAPCQMYDAVTGFCIKYGFDSGCLETSEDGGLMGCDD